MNTRHSEFRDRLRARGLIVGTFVKTPHPAVVEVLGLSGLDCICLDAEHAPFDRAQLDTGILAARSVDMPVLVRVPQADPAMVLNALDLGATGILAPHVSSAGQASELVAACRYGPHGRGYAGSTRAAAYGTRSLAQNIAHGNSVSTLILQIEDADAVREIDAIAAVEGVDALFIGLMDLTVSLGAPSAEDHQVTAAVESVLRSCRDRQRACGIFSRTSAEAHFWAERGASLFLLGSDQQWMLEGARSMMRSVNSRP